jgi:cellulose synthase/poly-beta-1,6-N-acetylglucosamine synthase-like glycosyltransferase
VCVEMVFLTDKNTVSTHTFLTSTFLSVSPCLRGKKIMISIIFTACLLTLGWAWIGYPLFLAVAARGDDSPSNPARGDDSPSSIPPVSILIAAYNEESVIAARLQNLAETDLPPNSEILLGCDGCDDQTVVIARDWTKKLPGLQVLDFKARRGKPAVLIDLVAQARNDILVFSDANTMFKKDAVTTLLVPLVAEDGSEFRVPGSELNNQEPELREVDSHNSVGGSCGRLIFTQPEGGETHENAYWKLETWLKIRESRIDSCLGANGAVYAIRKELFWQELPNNTIIDDFVIGMKVRESGAKMVYVQDAIATEETPAKVSDEWHRRVRIGAGAYQALALCRGCLHPRFGFFALAFFSHKVLRWFTPHLMMLLAFCTLLGVRISGGWFLWALFFAQATFYAATLIGRRVVPASRWGLVMRIPQLCHYFTAMQLALFTGFLRWCHGIQGGTWKRTER